MSISSLSSSDLGSTISSATTFSGEFNQNATLSQNPTDGASTSVTEDSDESQIIKIIKSINEKNCDKAQRLTNKIFFHMKNDILSALKNLTVEIDPCSVQLGDRLNSKQLMEIANSVERFCKEKIHEANAAMKEIIEELKNQNYNISLDLKKMELVNLQ